MEPRHEFNAELHGLRAIAILLVVIYHVQHRLLPGGYVGVDVFFVISGFLITGLLAREVAKTGTIRLERFYARRARRLLPAAIVVLVATVVAARLTYSPLELKIFATAAAATAMYVGNFWFAISSTDYLRAGEADVNPLLHYWSLCVEEQFYIVWPALILALLWAGRRSGRTTRTLTTGLLGATIVSLAISIVLTRVNQPWAFFGPAARAWEFALGGVTALLLGARSPLSASRRNAAGAGGLVLLALAAVGFNEQTPFPGIAAALPVAGTCLVLAASVPGSGARATAFLRTKPFQVIGDLSYSWYLWHWPVMMFLRMRAGPPVLTVRYLIGLGPGPSLGLGAAGAVLSLGLAWLTFVLIENPVRFSKALLARDRLSIAGGVTLALVGGLSGVAARQSASNALRSPAQQRYLGASSDEARMYADGCHADYRAVTVPDCTYGRRDADSTIVLFGDSHAAHWFPAAERVASERGWRLVAFSKSACPPIAFEPYAYALHRPYHECSEWRETALRRIDSLRPAIVVLAFTAWNDLHPAGDQDAPERLDEWRAGVQATFARLRPIAGTVMLLRDTPPLPMNAPQCLSRADWLGKDMATACAFSSAAAPAYSAEQVALEEAARSGFVQVLDMGPSICAGSRCAVERDGMVLFQDYHHLTATFSRSLAPELGARITEALRTAPR